MEFVVNKVKHQRAEGRLMEVIEKSPLETEEPCPHFGMCGGCTYQTVPYEKQLDMKLTQVKSSFRMPLALRKSQDMSL